MLPPAAPDTRHNIPTPTCCTSVSLLGQPAPLCPTSSPDISILFLGNCLQLHSLYENTPWAHINVVTVVCLVGWYQILPLCVQGVFKAQSWLTPQSVAGWCSFPVLPGGTVHKYTPRVGRTFCVEGFLYIESSALGHHRVYYGYNENPHLFLGLKTEKNKSASTGRGQWLMSPHFAYLELIQGDCQRFLEYFSSSLDFRFLSRWPDASVKMKPGLVERWQHRDKLKSAHISLMATKSHSYISPTFFQCLDLNSF